MESVVQLTAPAILLVPLTVSVMVPGHEIEPNSQARAAGPVIANWPAMPRGAQIRTLEQERSPGGRHQADGEQLPASRAPGGASVQGAENHV